TTQKRLENVRAFFSFCFASGWIQSNPAKLVKAGKVQPAPTMPYSDDEWEKIMWAVDLYLEEHPQSTEAVKKKIKAMLLLLRYSGIRISDAVSFKRDRIDEKGKLFIYTHKTGKPVLVPLPKEVVKAIDAADDGDTHLFWPGGKLKTWITEWEERL